MTVRTAVVVTFDQLPASILGCYGNEWIETPQLDQLASTGFVADQCWSAHVGPTSAETSFGAGTCVAALQAKSVRCSVFLEDASQTIFPVGDVQRRVLAGEHGPEAKPDRIPLAELVRAVRAEREASQTANRSSLFWLHARGLEIPAVPPAGFAELYQDEFEDRGVSLASLSDDERQSHPMAAAGMVSLFDHWLGQLFETTSSFDQPVLTVITAAAGANWQPWPNSFGDLDTLRGQRVHVPWIAQARGGDRHLPQGTRSAQLLTSQAIAPLLDWWFGESSRLWPEWLAQQRIDQVITRSATSGRRITRQEWAAIFPENDSTSLLFHKPEDYWEVNNQANVQPEIIEVLRRLAFSSERGTSVP